MYMVWMGMDGYMSPLRIRSLPSSFSYCEESEIGALRLRRTRLGSGCKRVSPVPIFLVPKLMAEKRKIRALSQVHTYLLLLLQ